MAIALTLVTGPAHARRVALLLDRYLAALQEDREPVLIVPNRSDVDRVERDLLARAGALLGGSIGTFDDLFASIARDGGSSRPVATVAAARSPSEPRSGERRSTACARSARTSGFADALAAAVGELESSFVEPASAPGHLGGLYANYRTSSTARGSGTQTDAAPRRGAARRGALGVGRAARLRLRVRGSDGRRVAPAEALAGRTGPRLAPVRARPAGVHLAGAVGRRPRRPRDRARIASPPVARVPAARARARRAGGLLRRRRACAAAHRRRVFWQAPGRAARWSSSATRSSP